MPAQEDEVELIQILDNLLEYIRRTDLDQAERAMEEMSISAQDMEALSSWAADMAIRLQRTD